MLYLKRKIDQVLLEWKENQSRKPLIIKGLVKLVKQNQY